LWLARLSQPQNSQPWPLITSSLFWNSPVYLFFWPFEVVHYGLQDFDQLMDVLERVV
jgi:hypothetical protein